MNQFCYWHIKTKENKFGTDCSAYLAEERIFECPYVNIKHAKANCSDYKNINNKKVK